MTLRGHQDLRSTARETLDALPSLLGTLGITTAAYTSSKHTLVSLPRPDPSLCPAYPRPATIRVVNEDTLDAAIFLARWAATEPHDPRLTNPRVAVLNFANRHVPGGGWLNGAMAQEEALCYRSSLALSLNQAGYPLAPGEAVYSPCVLVMRQALERGHRLLVPEVPLSELPVVSALTVAAIRRPAVRSFPPRGARAAEGPTYGSRAPAVRIFASDRDRNHTKDNMRLVLRIAAAQGHRMVVLGALGCGVFGNPPEDVAHCWLEVLRENEFSGNWWREVRFAVYDPKDEGNYRIFKRVLEGKEV